MTRTAATSTADSAPDRSGRIATAFAKHGLLLLSDRSLPSIAGLVIGGPVIGSWWAHPLCHEIYDSSQKLMRHGDALRVKFVNGKVTYVHRRLWPDFLAIVTASHPWQFESLPDKAHRLFEATLRAGCLTAVQGPMATKEFGDCARVLESRLLVFGDDVHTPAGAHVKRVEAWKHWAHRMKISLTKLPNASAAMTTFDDLVADLSSEFSVNAGLPWQRKAVLRSSRPRTA